ncbi:Outer membrane receptor for ferrienterochelin and colicins [Sphingomonas sp. NFR04]|uniref:TonB-dependent receptor n=1 Tax=Sphingomonas sp. NFR04 TaxID=1566283 RepID=UPI0008EB3D79|nr:TonB-dependent receptor [Sphingomonas sp. NFR04]SFJ96809.1 Outer membrane receptor for ferrienterochelin and colicins [Sphingomonas sp. NFR04]
MTISKRALCAAMLAATLSYSGMVVVEARAQVGATRFDLPAQNLASMLRAIARQGGREILFADEEVRGKRSGAIRGIYTVEQAVGLAIGEDLVAGEESGAIVVRGRPGKGGGEPAQEEKSDAITVTGSRIRGAEGPSPVIIVSRGGLEEQGIPDMASVSRILPQNFTGGQNPGVAGGGDQGGYNNVNNATTLNLRGLGSDATLTLINGHRLPYDAVNQGVDISIIPLAALERIEVITDGASALYGSDAVGGVANLILRRDYDGLLTSARVGTSTEGGNVQQQYSGVGGTRWAGGGFMAALDYSKATPIYADDRPYTRQLNAGQMLTTSSRQVSGVLAGHQDLASWAWFELDVQLADRRSRKVNAFSLTAPTTFYGQDNRPVVRSYAVTPSLHLRPWAGWEAILQVTDGESSTVINTQRYTNGTLSVSRAAYDNRLTNFEASAEGPLAHLPGGDIRLALGGGYRRFQLDFDVRTTSGGVTTVSRDSVERRNSAFGYGELSVPLVGAANRMPFIDALRLSGAVRYESYKGIGAVATPKLGLVYAPHRDITLKYSWGRSFKIPTLQQVNQAREVILLPASVFAPQPSPPLPAGATILAIGGGSPNLHAERARSSTLSAEVRPRFLPGLRVEATWYDIDYRDRIASPISDLLSALSNPAAANFVQFAPSVAEAQATVAQAATGLSNQSGQPFDPAKVAAIVDSSLRNIAREHIRGVDLSIDYDARLGEDSQLTIAGSATYLDADRQAAPNLPTAGRSGLIFTPPKFRARGAASWQTPVVQLSAALNYLDGTTDKRFSVPTRIGAFTTVDLSGSVRTREGRGPLDRIELRLSAQNLLDEQPDPIRVTNPTYVAYDSTNQSPIGRFVSFTVTKQW